MSSRFIPSVVAILALSSSLLACGWVEKDGSDEAQSPLLGIVGHAQVTYGPLDAGDTKAVIRGVLDQTTPLIAGTARGEPAISYPEGSQIIAGRVPAKGMVCLLAVIAPAADLVQHFDDSCRYRLIPVPGEQGSDYAPLGVHIQDTTVVTTALRR